MDKALEITFPYRNQSWLKRVSERFAREGRSALNMWFWALDGLTVKFTEPAAWKVPNSSTYYNRKGFFALNVQTRYDSQYRFTFLSCLSPGSTHENTAYALSELFKLLESREGGLLEGFWIAADDAYTCINRILTPSPGKGLSVAKDFFNYWQSSARIHIEQSFGMLVGRWDVFWRPLKCTVAKNRTIVAICCKLHKKLICLDIPPPSEDDDGNHTERADRQVHLQYERDLNEALHRRRRDLELSQLREDFTAEIEASARRRPCI